jgi:hypothetical protein
MLSVEMLPAGHGDALIVTYGTENQHHQILVDAGTRFSIDAIRTRLSTRTKPFELFVVTHVDEDHIGGALEILADKNLRSQVRNIWFNGYGQLVDGGNILGPREGEKLSRIIRNGYFLWNHYPGTQSPMAEGSGRVGGPIVVPASGNVPVFDFPGGAKLFLLSPTNNRLGRMAHSWDKAVTKAGLIPGQGTDVVNRPPNPRRVATKPLPIDDDDWLRALSSPTSRDGSAANGSSIAFIVEYDGKRVMLAADAHGAVLVSALNRLAEQLGECPVRVDLCKLPHHGSAGNVTTEFLAAMNCQRFLVSTNGDNFGHPDHPAMARIVMGALPQNPVTVFGNYPNEHLQLWADRYNGSPAVNFVIPQVPGVMVSA